MKRSMTLTALIMNLSVQFIFSIMMSIIIFNIEIKFEYRNWTALYIFTSILLACSVCCILLSALSIRLWNKQPKQFKKSSNILIANIILMFTCISGIVVLCFLGFQYWVVLICIIIILIIISNISLLMIDLCLNEKELNKQEKTPKNGIDQPSISFEEKLLKIQSIKERGLLSEQEFAQLKEELVEKEIKKPVQKQKTELELKIDKLESMKARGLISPEEFKQMKIVYIKQSIK